ncbi:hypothetical protein [Aliikangiella maris]|uniref:Uncharacterized protein n=1 Tax=Aliikangiella maris TaxID=3162458 RepID=A0ABV3MR21_9GAMM
MVNSNKIKIIGSEFFDTNLEYRVCSHLTPILDYLTKDLPDFDKNQKLISDRGCALTLKINFTIDLEELKQIFELPQFIVLSKECNAVVCRKCWCDIEGK